jgi:cytochrome c peroxidase
VTTYRERFCRRLRQRGRFDLSTISRALAAYIRTLRSRRSAFDRFLLGSEVRPFSQAMIFLAQAMLPMAHAIYSVTSKS